MKDLKAFYQQTAQDYDMELHDVERIAKIYPEDQFYTKLEEFIANRSK
jgi:hypothetical protein